MRAAAALYLLAGFTRRAQRGWYEYMPPQAKWHALKWLPVWADIAVAKTLTWELLQDRVCLLQALFVLLRLVHFLLAEAGTRRS